MTMDLSSLKPDQLRAINNIIGRLSLRQPQQDSLRALAVAILSLIHISSSTKRTSYVMHIVAAVKWVKRYAAH